MRERFVPIDFERPMEADLGEYKLVAITMGDTEEDLSVLLQNADTIVKQRGGGTKDGWPHKYSYEENLKDLAWLEECAEKGMLFSYILRGKKDDKYLGCMYIYPIELFFPEKAEDFDVDFWFWIIEDLYKEDGYDEMSEVFLNWLDEKWPFDKSRIFFRKGERPINL